MYQLPHCQYPNINMQIPYTLLLSTILLTCRTINTAAIWLCTPLDISLRTGLRCRMRFLINKALSCCGLPTQIVLKLVSVGKYVSCYDIYLNSNCNTCMHSFNKNMYCNNTVVISCLYVFCCVHTKHFLLIVLQNHIFFVFLLLFLFVVTLIFTAYIFNFFLIIF
jgi:hypothetical protein